MEDELRELLGLLNKAFLLHRKFFLKKSQSFGLYVGQPQLLSYVRSHPGCTQIEIAEALGVSSASIAFSTKRLQKAGYLMKQVNSLNMRCNKLYVTHEGMDVMDRFDETYNAMNQDLFAGFSHEDIERLADCAERFNLNLEKLLSEDDTIEQL